MLASAPSPTAVSENAGATVEYRSCVQCVDQNSGRTGCFISEAASAGQHRALSPVFNDYFELGHWMRDNGWASAAYVGSEYIPLRVVRVP